MEKEREESTERQVGRLAQFILDHVPGEPSENEGAVDTAIRLLKREQKADEEPQPGAERMAAGDWIKEGETWLGLARKQVNLMRGGGERDWANYTMSYDEKKSSFAGACALIASACFGRATLQRTEKELR